MASTTAAPFPVPPHGKPSARLTFAERIQVASSAPLLREARTLGALKRRLNRLCREVFPECKVQLSVPGNVAERVVGRHDRITIPVEDALAGRVLVVTRRDGIRSSSEDRVVASVLATSVRASLNNIALMEVSWRSQRSRSAAETRFEQLFEQFPLSVQLFSASGQTLKVNRAWRELFGLTFEDVKDFNPLHDPQLADVREQLERGFAGEILTIPAHAFTTIPWGEGEFKKLWLEVTVCPLKDEDGIVQEVLVIHRDITDEREAQTAIQESERQLREAQRLAHLGNWQWSVAEDRVTWSDELYRIYGRDPRHFEPSVSSYFSAVHEEDREHVKKTIQHVIETGEPFDFEERIVRPDGEVRVLHSIGEAVLDEQGNTIGLVGACHDITVLKHAEAAVRTSEESYRTIFELASDAIYVHDIETGAVLDANRQACLLHGRPLEDLKRLGIGGLSPEDERFNAENARTLVQKAAAGEPQRFEWIAKNSDGTENWVEVYLSRVHILGEDRVLASVRNINERKEAEAALQRAYDELEKRVEERTAELAERTEELEVVFRALPDLYFRLEPDGTILDYRAGRSFGLYVPPEEFLGKRVQEVLPSEIGEQTTEALKEVTRTGDLVQFEYELPDGDKNLEFEARMLPTAGGQVITIVRDVTARKVAERALRQSEEHFRRLIENASDIVQVLDAGGTLLYSGPSLARLLGYENEEMVGRSGFEFIHQEDMYMCYNALRQIVEHPEESVRVQYRVRHKDKSWRVFEAHARALSPTSAQEGIVVNSRDVTERVEAEQTLRFQKTLLEAEGEASIDGILVVAEDGSVLSTNRRFAEMFGITDDVLAEGSDDALIASVLDKLADPEGFLARVRELYSQPDAKSRDEIVLRDGRVFDRFTAPVRSMEGDDYGRIWFFRDMTEQKRRAEELEAAQLEAKQYAESLERSLQELQNAQMRLVQQEKMASLGRLTSGIAHEIKNPLNFVINFAELNQETITDMRDASEGDGAGFAAELLAEIEENTQRIREHGMRANKIVQKMMEHMRAGSDERVPQRQPVDLNKLVEEELTSTLTRHRREGGVEVEVIREYGENVGTIDAVPHDLGRAVNVLLANAVEALEERAETEASLNGKSIYTPTLTVRTDRNDSGVLISV
ncbi:MAG: PAS domain S-box protein, partial [Rubricoccaceae bacterium]|nr:PAS domain S-box protein [Rubricoccaceae bacterium]